MESELHRLVPVNMASQLLAVPGDQEQRVVRAGADDQDRQDGLALAVDREVGVLREEIDHPWETVRATPEQMIGRSHSTGLR